jgi:hypothetical protein
LLEKSLFGYCLGLLFAGLLLVALANPPSKLTRLAMSLSSAATAMRNRRRARGVRIASALKLPALRISERDMSALREQWAANEFAFEHAIEAY